MTHTESLDKLGLTTRDVTRNILRVFADRTDDDHAKGLVWYREAQGLAEQIASDRGISVNHAAVMIAHLSPRCRWSENKRLALQLARTGDATGTIRSHVDKARRAIDSDDPWSTFGPAAVKTRNFAMNITGVMDAVTVDVWACRIAGIPEDKLSRKGVYEAVAHCYRVAARRGKVSPAQMQAITWCVARGKAE